MTRPDLLALTTHALALYANLGLVKRAQKEVEGGHAPTLEEVDGLVIARARDGAVTRLPPEVPLKATSCTCGAAMCRHRLAAVLAYQRVHGPTEAASWDPAAFDDAALTAACGEASIERARELLGGPLTVRVEGGTTPTARLPTSTVQFVVPMALAFARCDCVRGAGCEHVVVAVWAFRRAVGAEVVELGAARAGPAEALLADLEDTLTRALGRGLLELGAEVEVADARARADRAGLLWVADTLADLERQRDAWERRSAAFSGQTLTALLMEAAARLRAARRGSLPISLVLGSGEARETVTDQLRLTPLGVRLRADGEQRFAELYLADRDTRQTYVLAKAWPAPNDTPARNGHQLGELYASSRLTLSSLARADLVARASTRKANGHLDLGLARGLKSSSLPGQVGWADLPEPIAVDDLDTFERGLREGLPAWLGPRRVGAHIHVVRIGRVVDLAFSRGDQVLTSQIEGERGGRILVRVGHRSVSPGAIDATAQALGAAPRFISGEVSRTRGGLVLEPLAILGTHLVVPDLERPHPQGALPPHDATTPTWAGAPDPVEEVLVELQAFVERGATRGLAALGPRETLARRLADMGLSRVAEAVSRTTRAGDLLDLIHIQRALELSR